jgi:protein SCO1/2
MLRKSFALVALLLLPALGSGSATADSIYALHAALIDQGGQDIPLDTHRGHPVLISMFYASCGYVCPTLIANVHHVEDTLDAPARARLRVLMVSIDPDHDTPPVLAELATKHDVDLGRWTFARADAADVRKIASLLGVQYRQLPGGGFNHSVVVTLLDGEGVVLARSTALSGAPPPFLQALRAATAAMR